MDESLEKSIIEILFSSVGAAKPLIDHNVSQLNSCFDYDGTIRYREDISSLGKHSNSDNNRLLKNYIQIHDPQIFDLLVEGNMHIVVRIASVLAQEYPQIDEQDLISEGYFGLERAINGYIVGYNSSFAAYASLSILRSMQRYIAINLSVVSHPAGWLNKTIMLSKYLEDKGIDDVSMITPEDRLDIRERFKLSERSLSLFLSTYPYNEYNLNTCCIRSDGRINSLLTNIISNSIYLHPADLSFFLYEPPRYRALLSSRDILYLPKIDLKDIICDILECEVYPMSVQEILNSLKKRCPLCVFSEEQVVNILQSPLFSPITNNENTFWLYCDYVSEREKNASLSLSNQKSRIDYNELSLDALISLLSDENGNSNSNAEEDTEDFSNNSTSIDSSLDSADDDSDNDDIIKMIFG